MPARIPVMDPEDGAVVGYAAQTTVDEVSGAIGHLADSWRNEWPAWERERALGRAAETIADRSERFTALIAAEGVKTAAEARDEVTRCVETLWLAASASGELLGESLPFDATPRGAGKIGWYARAPLGVVGAITPYNDPLNLVAHKVAPALLAGNGVILKPSEHTPLTALAFAEVLLEVGVPGDRIAVVCGGPDVGRAIVSDPRIAALSFTGGPRTAEAITRTAGVKKLLMELGGNNPTVVCEDADLELAAAAVVDGAFGAAGQNCLSVQRVYVHARVHDRFLDGVIARTKQRRVGSKRATDSDIGPLIDEQAARKVECLVDRAIGQGARALTGARRHGVFYEPTVLVDVPEGSDVMTAEVFGPVVAIEPFTSYAAVVASANTVGQALHAGVFTASVTTARTLSQQLHAGCVLVNATSDFRIDAMPFGGFGSTGIGREGVRHAVRELSAPKSVVLAE
ncbi:aldehyde dehydrogenase family protein [Prauserella alba]|uniref:Aldehyde dehydrogenase family protein n=1 Tax=Prauserella alba TaxID=176898 RepID=A0ABP4G1F5_9PSEU|nr:aldehyde dehydrogenase family protein [Prauserella alba]